MADEELIIRHRLLTGATVVTKGPSIKSLATNFFSLRDSVLHQSPADSKIQLEQILKELDLFEFEVCKAAVVRETCIREMQKYSEDEDKIGQQIQSTVHNISQLKGKLAEETVIRKRKDEYEALAKSVNKFPTLQKLSSDCTNVEVELRAIQETDKRVSETMRLRSQQLQSLLHSVYNLQRNIFEDEQAKILETQANDAEMAEADSDGEVEEEAVTRGLDDDVQDEELEEREERSRSRRGEEAEKIVADEANEEDEETLQAQATIPHSDLEPSDLMGSNTAEGVLEEAPVIQQIEDNTEDLPLSELTGNDDNNKDTQGDVEMVDAE